MPRRQFGPADVALALVAGAVCVFGSWGAQGRLVPPLEPLDAVGWGLILLACAALTLWRRWPVATFAVVTATVVGYLAGRYPYGPIFVVQSLAMYAVAVRVGTRRAALWCLVAYAGTVATLFAVESPLPVSDAGAYLGTWAFTLVTPLLVGVIVRLRRQYGERIQRREAELARVRMEDEFARRTYEERLGIARDVHDVVAHGLSVISMQSGGALHIFDDDPRRAREALQTIRATSQTALRELRDTLDVLRQGPGQPTAADDVSLDRLTDLVERMANGGLAVTVHSEGDPRPLSEPVDAAAYRIVQESLTNVLRHAGTGRAAVRVGYETEAVLVEVTDEGTGEPGPEGHGIIGMRERAAQVGGTLTAGPRSRGGFAVRAFLPVPVGGRAAAVVEEGS